MTLWEGRFSSGPSSELMSFTESLSFDKVLWREDIRGSKAHVRGLIHSGIISSDDGEALLDGLDKITAEFEDDRFVFLESDEDIHSAIERRLTELLGDVGAKLHTGRSRNDQIATDMRMFSKRVIAEVGTQVVSLCEVFLEIARSAKDSYLPGYTHTQRAQPILLSHHLLAHGWAFLRDLDRLVATYRRLDVSPLGAGALGGSTLPLDPDFVASELGFSARFANSVDVVSDRDFVAEILFDIALLGVHLSRVGEEFILWSTEEFGFVRLDDAYSTGSSLLPHKKNADIAELARGKTGRLVGNLMALLTTLKGLPLSYNRDLQEDKEGLFDSVKQVSLALKAVRGMIATSSFDFGRMKSFADSEYLVAVDLAEFLVKGGMPFRKAHSLVGSLVRDSIERRVPLYELVSAHPLLGAEASLLLEPASAIRRRITPGGSGQEAVASQLSEFSGLLDQQRKAFAELG
jgi:argininosuccinate lyase